MPFATGAIHCAEPGTHPHRDRDELKEFLHGTLFLMVLKTLDMIGPFHGYGVARRIELISRGVLSVNHGTLYPVLVKLEREGAIASRWGASENHRRARFYRLTGLGRKRLVTASRDWLWAAQIMRRFVNPER